MVLKITALQTNIFWENIDKNINDLNKEIDTLEDSDLIILPEMFTTGFSMNAIKLAEEHPGKTLNWMQEISARNSTMILGSMPVKDDGFYYNRLYIVNGGEVQFYDKKHLFTMAKEQDSYSAGKTKIITKHKGWKILPLICYDLRFPIWSRNSVNNNSYDYDILIYIANWPAKRSSAWVDLLKARAIENSCYTIGVNRVGIDGNGIEYDGESRIFDFLGNRLDNFQPNKAMNSHIVLEKARLEEYRKKFPVLEDADPFRLID